MVDNWRDTFTKQYAGERVAYIPARILVDLAVSRDVKIAMDAVNYGIVDALVSDLYRQRRLNDGLTEEQAFSIFTQFAPDLKIDDKVKSRFGNTVREVIEYAFLPEEDDGDEEALLESITENMIQSAGLSGADAQRLRQFNAYLREAEERYGESLDRQFAREQAEKQVAEEYRAKGYMEVTFDEETEPTPAQAAAIDYFIANQDRLSRLAIESVVPYARESTKGFYRHRKRKAAFTYKVLPPEVTADQLYERMECNRINFSREERDGIAYIEVSFDFTWDEEHACLAVLHRDRIVDVLDAGGQWVDKS